MHSSDEEYVRNNYRNSIRRYREERIKEIKEFFSAPHSDASGKEMLLGTAVFLALGFSIVIAALKCGKDNPSSNRSQVSQSKSDFRPSYSVGTPYVSQLAAPRAQPRFTAMNQDKAEMTRKYKEIVKKKQRLLKATDANLRKYTKYCLKEPMGRSRKRYCENLDKKNQQHHEWLNRH